MKLIDMLINAFEITGGWPQGIDAISQEQHGLIRGYVNVNGHLYMYPLYMLQLSYGLAEDYETAIITREQYEVALAASQKVEWDGNGLPPVGCEFEYGTHRTKAKCLAIGHHMVFASKGNLDDEEGDYEEFMIDAQIEFHPIRSEADKKRDEAIEKMIEAYFKAPPIDEPNEYDRLAMNQLYSAISAGKIPGVRIE